MPDKPPMKQECVFVVAVFAYQRLQRPVSLILIFVWEHRLASGWRDRRTRKKRWWVSAHKMQKKLPACRPAGRPVSSVLSNAYRAGQMVVVLLHRDQPVEVWQPDSHAAQHW